MTATNPFRIALKSRPMAVAVERILGLHRLAACYEQRPENADTQEFLDFALNYLGIRLHTPGGEQSLEQIPRSGPLLIVANHPLGGLEGIAITKLLMAIRPDIKVLTNELLTRIPEFQSIFVGVNVLSENAARENIRGIRQVSRHLEEGGALLMFPAGKVSAINVRNRRIEDQPWNRLAGKLLQRSGATCLPIHVGGYNSKLFYSLGLIHPKLRTAMLPRELTNKQNSTLSLTIGEPITPAEVRHLENERAITDYLRLATDFLNLQYERASAPSGLTFAKIPEPGGEAHQHLQTLTEFRLIESDTFDVYCVPYDRLGPVMTEIGIAREVTFRDVGEGTGNSIDTDRFDPNYLHLFIWDKNEQRIAGGYRIGHPHSIADEHGMDALYARTLFNFDREYLDKVGCSLEMGRSFVYPEYQRHPMVLDLLWRGIGAYVAKNPQYHTLFGAVSISREYSNFARALIAESMVTAFPADQEYMEDVNPIVPLKVSKKPWSQAMLKSLKHVSALNKLVGRCDPDKGLPTLLRHYLSLNGKFVCFSVNKVFNDSLDGLILVDMRKMPSKYLKRYLGKEGAKGFMEKWQAEE
ncbi:lysophospholipid acyltransferase family protein [Porticoccus sp. W117]|uniref:lysophospholipid acyltransferase family protein n=1 Tax=Porticoccus sp. W117 TaxID=3054777 RepID=UPI002593498C|nr:lysophospholipid acyltransferase family protein [Porticoccus sp. W117]MDM3871611.1 lysophospholipid acyltransferase family protein [Porticoccus sp. W117]